MKKLRSIKALMKERKRLLDFVVASRASVGWSGIPKGEHAWLRESSEQQIADLEQEIRERTGRTIDEPLP